ELRREDEEVDDELGQQRPDLERETKTLAHRADDRVMADGGKAAGHLAEKGDAHRAERDGPQQAEPERRTGLQRRAHRSDFDVSADARQDAERDRRQPLHRTARPAAGTLEVPEAPSHAAKNARPTT